MPLRVVRTGFATVAMFLVARLTPALAQCNCRNDLDSLASRIEQNYIGFRFEVARTPRETEFRGLIERLRARADTTADVNCIFLLRELTGWFHDGHVFVVQAPRVSADDARRLAGAAERFPLTEDGLRADLRRRGRGVDPIEGIWYARGYRLGVTHDGAGFVAVVLRSDSSQWQAGQVKARFHKLPGGVYRAVIYADDHSRRDVDMTIYRNTLLSGGANTWGRAFPLAPYEAGPLDSLDPQAPTVRIVGTDAVVVSVPSHDPGYTAPLRALMTSFRDALTTRPILIIDIRGDLGGGSMTTAPLVPFLVSRDMNPPIGPSGLSMVLSSADNIRYFGRGWNPDSIAQRMAAAPGQVMPLMRNEPLGMPFPNDTVLAMPPRVAVLMDRGVASAGEAFALQARRSTKVTLFGQNSAGMIDYQSVMIVRLACPAAGNLLGYPMIAASPTLPTDGLNAAGIPVEVAIPPQADDQVDWVLRYYAGH